MEWVVVTKTDFMKKGIKPKKNFLFAKGNIVTPLSLFELHDAVSNIPIVFAEQKDQLYLCGVLGLKQNQNLFVDDYGGWIGEFCPAHYQVFPFRAGQDNEKRKVLLYFKESDMLVDRSQGDPLFDEDGGETELLKKYMSLLVDIRNSATHFEKIATLIKSFELLEPLKIQVGFPGSSPQIIEGLLGIDFKKVDNLDDEQVIELRNCNALAVLFAHFYSMACFKKLVKFAKIKEKATDPMMGLGKEIFSDKDGYIDLNFD